MMQKDTEVPDPFVSRSRAKRLMDDRLAEKIGETKEGNVYKAIYRKTGVLML